MARQNPPDLLITDILMPVMDGFQLCLRWKSDDRLRRIPLIFYTATYTDPQDERFALSLGAERFVIKPQKPDILMRTVDDVLLESEDAELPELPRVDSATLQEYNEVLFRKLQKKVLQLEEEKAQRQLLQENERRAYMQIERNLEQMATLTDHIRNPLSLIRGPHVDGRALQVQGPGGGGGQVHRRDTETAGRGICRIPRR